MGRPPSCYGNHWRLPAATVQQTQFPHQRNPASRLGSPLGAIKIERASSGSPQLDRSVTDPLSSYNYVSRSTGNGRKPPPLQSTNLDFRSVPMEHQYSSDTNMDSFHSPQSMTSPSYTQFSSDTNSLNSAGLYPQQPRYSTFAQPRVHDIHLDDGMSISIKSNAGTPSMASFPNGPEVTSAQTSPFNLDNASQLQAYASPVSVAHQHYNDQSMSLIEDLRYQMPMTNYPAYVTAAPEWYTNIKPEETWPGYSLPSERLP